MPAIAFPQLRWTLLPLLTGSILLPLTAAAQQPERYAVAGDEVAIYNLAGEVQVLPGPGPDVTAEATRGGADAAKLKVVKGEIDGRETLRFLYPSDRILYAKLSDGSSTQIRVRDDGTFGDDDWDDHGRERRPRGKQITISRAGGLDAYADLRVTVPTGKTVAIYLAAGKVAATNVNGDLSIDVASAPVATSNTRGQLDIDVGSGAVQVTQARGDLTVDTGSGTVAASDVRGESVSIETGSGAVTSSDVRSSELKIETGSGDIQVTNLMAPHVQLETGSGSVSADLNGEVWNVGVQTGSGDVTLKMPPTIGAEVDIETSSGDIETDFEVAVTRHARDHMTGRIGDGRGKIAIETGSGGIKLVKGRT
jgi:lia operon protein LiaG